MRKHQAAFSPFPVYITPSHFFLPRAVRAARSRSSSFLFCLPAGTKFLIAARAASRPTPCGLYREACIFTVQARPAACNQNFLRPPAAAGERGLGIFTAQARPAACDQNFLMPPAAAWGGWVFLQCELAQRHAATWGLKCAGATYTLPRAEYFFSATPPSGMQPKFSKASGSGGAGLGIFTVQARPAACDQKFLRPPAAASGGEGGCLPWFRGGKAAAG